jgi:hypothetical protein
MMLWPPLIWFAAYRTRRMTFVWLERPLLVTAGLGIFVWCVFPGRACTFGFLAMNYQLPCNELPNGALLLRYRAIKCSL